MRLLISNIGRLATVGRGPRVGRAMRDIGEIRDAAVLIDDAAIARCGPRWELPADLRPDQVLDAGGGLVIPGLIDPHTHLCFAAPASTAPAGPCTTAAEYVARARAVAAATVDASRSDLAEAIRPRLAARAAAGFTTVEIKSGFGLSPAEEIKSLEAIADLALSGPIGVVPTFFGAHVIPTAFDDAPDEYVLSVIKQMVPAAAHGMLARFVDVFCDAAGFSAAAAFDLLARAAEFDLPVKVHAGLFEDCGAARTAARFGAVSVDHLVHVRGDDLRLLAAVGTVAVLLPTAALAFGAADPPARAMIDAGVAVALGSDENPIAGSTEPAARLAVSGLGMTPEEVLTACTANAAAALGLAGHLGALEPGMQADLAILDADGPADWIAGAPVRAVIKHGRVIGGPAG